MPEKKINPIKSESAFPTLQPLITTVSKNISKPLDFKWIADVSQEAVKVRSVRTLRGIIRLRTKMDVLLL